MRELKIGTLIGVVGAVGLIAGVLLTSLVGGERLGSGFQTEGHFSQGIRVGYDDTQVIDDNAKLVAGVSSTQAVSLTGNVTSTGNNHLARLVHVDVNGALPDLTIATTSPNELILTAAQTCDNTIINVANGVSASGTVRLASTTAMSSSNCLASVGDTYRFVLWNVSSTGVLALSAGGSSSLMTAISATSSIDFREIVEITAMRVTSGSQPWLLYHYRHAQ